MSIIGKEGPSTTSTTFAEHVRRLTNSAKQCRLQIRRDVPSDAVSLSSKIEQSPEHARKHGD